MSKINEELDRLQRGLCSQPHAVLGMHPVDGGVMVRTLQPGADKCLVVEIGEGGQTWEMNKDGDVFVLEIEGRDVFPYRLQLIYSDGHEKVVEDPYRFLPTVSDESLHDFGRYGDPWIFKKAGVRKLEHQGVEGWSFSVWAPKAYSVYLVFYPEYDPPVSHCMRSIGSTGVWEIFVPSIPLGMRYKFHIRTQAGDVLDKTDPMALDSEGPPNHASILTDLEEYCWGDQEWMEERNKGEWQEKPMSVYEVHMGSWMEGVDSYREAADKLGDYVKKMGFTHVEFLPLNEHPLLESWGYQVTGYYGICHRYGSPHDFMYLVDSLHQKGIGVIMDWVPAHFPKDAFALEWFDGGRLYEYGDEWKREHRDWGTYVFDYGRPEVRSFLMGSAMAWLERFHIDGLRVDAVASMLYLDYSRGSDWVPNIHGGNENLEAVGFIKQANHAIRTNFPGVVMIAEESTAFGDVTDRHNSEHSLNFHLKWNMGWMHDMLKFFQTPPDYRKDEFGKVLHCRDYQFAENFMQVFSHDEVVHGKGSLINKMEAGWDIPAQAADLRTLYTMLWMWPGKKTLFMGQEFGQTKEWNVNAKLDWNLLQYDVHSGIQNLVADLNHLYVQDSTLAKTESQPLAFQWLDISDGAHITMSFIRWGYRKGEIYIVAMNFGALPRDRDLVVPEAGIWQPVLHSALSKYGGTLETMPEAQVSTTQGEEDQIRLTLHPFSAQVWELCPKS